MLKYFSICTAFIVIGTGSIHAQQREAVLQTIEVPGAVFDIVLAMPKTSGATIDLGRSPEALVMHLVGGELALVFESVEQMLETLDVLQTPVGAVPGQRTDSNSPIPVAVYIAPKADVRASAKK